MSSIQWVLQDNIYKEYGYVEFVKTLRRMGEHVTIVKPVPFSNILLSVDGDVDKELTDADSLQINATGPVICFGSMALRRIAIAQNLKPGKLGNDIFNYADWKKGFGEENILNPDVQIGELRSFFGYVPTDDVFVRPTKDDKALTGTVMSPHDFQDWVSTYSVVEPDELIVAMLNKTTEILVSSVKEIYSECRMFVVGGKVVTGSMYKIGTTVRHNKDVDQRFYDFAQQMIDKYCPEDGIVIDIADTPCGLKIIELNDFNCSGFYACDVQKIIEAVINLLDGENNV